MTAGQGGADWPKGAWSWRGGGPYETLGAGMRQK